MIIIDLKDSPYKDSKAKNGFDSISKGIVILKSTVEGQKETPHCILHGAMNKVDPSGLWRCLICNEGAYQTD